MLYRIRELAFVAVVTFAALRLGEAWHGLQDIALHVAIVMALLIIVDAFFDILVWGARRLISYLEATRGT